MSDRMMRLVVGMLALVHGATFARADVEADRRLATHDIGGVTVSLHGWTKSGWLHVRLENPSDVPVRAQFTVVLHCPSKKTPVVTAPGTLLARPGTTEKSWDAVAGCPGFTIDAFEARDVQFGQEASQRATCTSTLPTLQLGLNPKKEVAWIRVKTGERTITLSRATLLGLPEGASGDPPRRPRLLALGGTHQGQPAAVSMEALLDELCKWAPPSPSLRTQALVALEKYAVKAVDAAVKLYCAHVDDPDCAPCIKKRIKPSDGTRG